MLSPPYGNKYPQKQKHRIRGFPLYAIFSKRIDWNLKIFLFYEWSSREEQIKVKKMLSHTLGQCFSTFFDSRHPLLAF